MLKISGLAFSGFKKKISGLAISGPEKKLAMPTSGSDLYVYIKNFNWHCHMQIQYSCINYLY
jgi:hypothetical protein